MQGNVQDEQDKQESKEDKKQLVKLTEAYVRNQLANNDGSHDWWHIERVWRVAVELAKEEKMESEKLLVVELAALLHDLKDWKYAGSESAGPQAVTEFLLSVNCPDTILRQVVHIVTNIGFKNELSSNNKTSLSILTPELAVVQDADRLDAIGAIGIARCFTYGGTRNRMLYDPDNPPIKDITKEQYIKQNSTNSTASINHFYEKLLRLKDMMKTSSGKKRAIARHDYMKNFLDTFFQEWNGRL